MGEAEEAKECAVTISDYCIWSKETRCRLAELPLSECDCEKCLAFTPNDSYGE